MEISNNGNKGMALQAWEFAIPRDNLEYGNFYKKVHKA